MIHFRTGKYVVNLLIEKLQNYEEELDTARLFHFAGLASLKTSKTFGLVFDLPGLNSDQLHQSLAGNRSTHRIGPDDKTFNARWRLYYDEYFNNSARYRGNNAF